MVDVFNVDKKISDEHKYTIAKCFDHDLIRQVIQHEGKTESKNTLINAYINKGITKTRGFHVDDFKPVSKVFLYLSDVETLEDGPYCYVPGHHTASSYSCVNKKLAKEMGWQNTETPIVDQTKITPILGGAGTLVISDQAGPHRGIPQSSEGSRMVLVAKYTFYDTRSSSYAIF